MKTRLFNFLKYMAVLVPLIVGLLPTQSASALGTRRYAKPGGLMSGDCTSWAIACDLRYAMSPVAASGDEIWAQAGVYLPTTDTERSHTFALPDGVKVYGGFAGGETLFSQRNPKANLTVLSGNIATAGSYHVVTTNFTTPASVLDGFTIFGGNANGGGVNQNIGGGILNLNGRPTLSNLIIVGNYASSEGAGMYNGVDARPILTNVAFTSNKATRGGGMYNNNSLPVLNKVSFNYNSATDNGGGMFNHSSLPKLTSVSFSGNWAASSGGGMYSTMSNVTMTLVVFRSNYAKLYGGGMVSTGVGEATITSSRFVSNVASHGAGMSNDSKLTLVDVTFHGNAASGFAGGLYNLNAPPGDYRNVTFSRNTAQTAGALYNENSNPVIQNATFTQNVASVGGAIVNLSGDPMLYNITVSGNKTLTNSGAAGMHSDTGSLPVVRNSIFWGNVGGEVSSINGSVVTFDFVVLKGGCLSTPEFVCGNIFTLDPKLGPLAYNGGFTQTKALLPGSSAIDKGLNATCTQKDQRGVARPQGIRCDMGAYELVP